jgi:hypothetical protein
VPVAQQALDSLMMFWRTEAGTSVLATALAIHVFNALWSIYIRRYLRLPAWELAQLSLGLSIPPLLMLHVVGTKICLDHGRFPRSRKKSASAVCCPELGEFIQ